MLIVVSLTPLTITFAAESLISIKNVLILAVGILPLTQKLLSFSYLNLNAMKSSVITIPASLPSLIKMCGTAPCKSTPPLSANFFIAFSSMYGDIVRHEMLGLLPGSTSIS